MNTKPQGIESIDHLLAQVYAMKTESETRLQNLIDSLEQHHNYAAADIFSRTMTLIQTSIREIETDSQNRKLPTIAPWEIQWQTQQADCQCMDQAHYLMSTQQALDLALANEICFHDFFKQQSTLTNNKAMLNMIHQLLEKERQLTATMSSWRASLSNKPIVALDDFDPPFMPE